MRKNKYALIVCNAKFDKVPMDNLNPVYDDLQTAKQTVKMMGILETNIETMVDITYEEMIESYTNLTKKIIANTKELKN